VDSDRDGRGSGLGEVGDDDCRVGGSEDEAERVKT